MQADNPAASGFVQVGEACEQQFDGGEQQGVAVHARGVVGVELEVDGGRRGGGAGDGDAVPHGSALLGGKAIEEDRAGVEREALQLRGGRGV